MNNNILDIDYRIYEYEEKTMFYDAVNIYDGTLYNKEKDKYSAIYNTFGEIVEKYKNKELDLMEYTGVRDDKTTVEYPNGQKIYRKDIVIQECRLASNEKPFKGVVEFYNGVYFIDNDKEKRQLFSGLDTLQLNNLTVIGNVYENPELLN